MTNNCGNCKFLEVELYEEPCSSCRCTRSGTPTKWVSQHEPPTNADRIRAMSDEELADWIARTQIANIAEALAIAKIPYEQEDVMKDKVAKECLEWLKQPYL